MMSVNFHPSCPSVVRVNLNGTPDFRGARARSALLAATLAVVACAPPGSNVERWAGRQLPEADALFRRAPRWLGADAALSVPLAQGRTLWLFGDTFISTSNARVRSESEMVRNTVAIQTGGDPRRAEIAFHWRQKPDGKPGSFFPERGQRWYWPGHGIRLAEGPLVIFLHSIVQVADHGLGFASAGYAIAVIDNPDEPVSKWATRVIDAPPGIFDAIPATAVIRDGGHVVALAVRQKGVHAGALVRYPAISLARGEITGAEWWAGPERGWIPASSLGARGPAFVIDDAGSECSLHWDRRRKSFVHIASYGFGASTIGMRTAAALTGPWSQPVAVFRPPESDGPKPFVYAAKAHPEITGPDAEDLVITYVANSFEFGDLIIPGNSRSLYWPRFVVVQPER